MNEEKLIYDSFLSLEDTLINEMIKGLKANMSLVEKDNVTLWYIRQLKELQKYKKNNRKYFKSRESIEKRVKRELMKTYNASKKDFKKKVPKILLNEIDKPTKEEIVGFNDINERKLNALIEDTTTRLFDANTSAITYADTNYSKIIFNSQVLFQSSTYTLAQAIDKSTCDFMSKGINNVMYANGKSVNVQSYCEMVLRTAHKKAYLQGEASARDEYGINTVMVLPRGNGCPKCMPFVNKVYIDDVFSNNKNIKNKKKYPLLSGAVEKGLYHPNCRDSHTTYFDGITDPPKPLTKEEEKECIRKYELEQHQRYLERTVRKYDRLKRSSVDEADIERYSKLLKTNKDRLRDFVNEHEELSRKYYRERNYGVDNQ